MSLSEGEIIAIAVCVPVGVVLLAVIGFVIYWKFIRVKQVEFVTQYVDDNGNIRCENLEGDVTTTATNATENQQNVEINNNNVAPTSGVVAVAIPQTQNQAVPVFTSPHINNNNQQGIATTTTTTTKTTKINHQKVQYPNSQNCRPQFKHN
jgi:hypothetical protein